MAGKQFALIALLTGMPLSAIAAPDTYTIDPQHTYPSFEFGHMGLSVWRGKFNKTHGRITLDRAAHSGTVDVTTETASINFGLEPIEEKARSDDFFDSTQFPIATFKGKIRFSADKPASVDGEITLMGVTHPMALNIRQFNCMPHPMLKKEVCGADAEGDLNWSEYGMKKSEYGKGDAGKVHLRIQVEALKD